MRLNKYLANSGLGSRRECDALIQNEGVSINGNTLYTPGYQVQDDDEIFYKEKRVQIIEKVEAIILNKPLEFLTSISDTHGRKTIYDLLPDTFRNFKYAGRLDYNSTGLILLVNRSKFAEAITNPKNKVDKLYRVKCQQVIDEDSIIKLREGVELDDGIITKPAIINRIDKLNVEVIISEGKKRQVRRMFDAVGNRVDKLHRESIGSIELSNLKIGQYRYLTENELNLLFADC